jgi:prepilin-type N-terminal cleavage/methylation domain-containing protein
LIARAVIEKYEGVSERIRSMNKKGFTLIELLVVIAIIALLLSIIMPSLRLAKVQAQKTICQSNVKQWGIIWNMYLDDYKSVFPTPFTGQAPKQHWFSALRSYYQDPKIRSCPTAANPDKKAGSVVFNTWGPMGAAGPNDWWEQGDYGSYGINSWTYKPPAGLSEFINMPSRFYWGKRTTVKSLSSVPLMSDEMWVDTWPLHTDQPPVEQEKLEIGTYHMHRVCLNRHNGNVGVLFMDSSARMVGLKSLWSLKWHQEFDVGYTQRADYPWPDWMAKFKAY